MNISDYSKYIFIHVFKTAGTSISKCLADAEPDLGESSAIFIRRNKFSFHTTASDLIALMGRKVFDSYYSFAFVRNPWDWHVSHYRYILRETGHHEHQRVKNITSFDSYVRWRCAGEYKLQKDFICSPNGEILVDFVGVCRCVDVAGRISGNRLVLV